ncbi:UPF0547 protein C16orf87 homolog [Atheta coriaria]|uniref:UPF0547 protein C16orf87 homolog n=1 Tax=Dalotia coriaria TaxID=877792 RepID=UPI0031F370EF
MIAKGCPKCDQQVPVACKACPCGHSFFNARKTAKVTSIANPQDDIRRRTQRVRREKPDYYDALEYDKQVKKTKTRHSECDNDEDGIARRELSKPKRKKMKKEEDDDDDIMANLSPEKHLQCSLILEELNRKMQVVTWKPSD